MRKSCRIKKLGNKSQLFFYAFFLLPLKKNMSAIPGAKLAIGTNIKMATHGFHPISLNLGTDRIESSKKQNSLYKNKYSTFQPGLTVGVISSDTKKHPSKYHHLFIFNVLIFIIFPPYLISLLSI
jgi:hypothetical protein